ncbi:MAG: YhdP family protein [Wolinella sp.]
MKNISPSSASLYKAIILALFILTLMWGFYRVLRNGIFIPSLQVASVELRGFYLSLDKKLIARLDSANFTPLLTKQTKKQGFDLKSTLTWIKSSKILLESFQEIHIKELIASDIHGSFLYKDSLYKIEFPDILATFSLNENQDELVVDIKNFIYNPYHLTFQGAINYQIIKSQLRFLGNLALDDAISLHLKGKSDFKKIHIEGSSLPFASLRFLRNLVNIENPNINAWLYENIIASEMNIRSFSFEGELSEESLLKSLEKGTKVHIEMSDPKVRFHPELPKIDAQKIDVYYDASGVHFKLSEPMFEGFPLAGSEVALLGIWGENPLLDIFIKTKARLNESILQILRAYKIKLPLIQHDSSVLARLKLEVSLNTYTTHAVGYFEAKESNFSLGNLPFYAHDAKVKLEDSLITVLPSRLRIANILEGELACAIDTHKERLEGDIQVLDFSLGKDGGILNLKESNLPFHASFKEKEIPLHLPTLHASLHFGESLHHIKLGDLGTLYPHSRLLQGQSIRTGEANISTKDFHTFSFNALIGGFSYPLRERTGEEVKSLKIEGILGSEHANIRSHDGRLKLEIDKEIKLFAKDYDILLPEIGEKQKDKMEESLYISGENLHFLYKNRRIISQTLEGYLNGPEDMTALLSYNGALIDIELKKGHTKISARNLPDHFVNTFLGKKVVYGGRYSLKGDIKNGAFKGRSTIERGVLKNLNTFQNVIALLDTIPSLLIFKTPGFNAEGYAIEQGKIEFGINDHYLIVEDFDFKGTSINSEGFGLVNLKNDEIEFQTRLTTLKSLGNIVNSIPVVGYIIMGEDGSFSTNVEIKGTLNDPKSQSTVAKDTIRAPFGVIERAIKTPLRLLKQ